MTPAERLIVRLRHLGIDLPEGSRLVRVYPSEAARSSGAWSWTALDRDGRDLRIGSQHSMGELLSADTLAAETAHFGADVHIVPATSCRRCDARADTACRICRGPFCRACFTDHHHEGYGAHAESSW